MLVCRIVEDGIWKTHWETPSFKIQFLTRLKEVCCSFFPDAETRNFPMAPIGRTVYNLMCVTCIINAGRARRYASPTVPYYRLTSPQSAVKLRRGMLGGKMGWWTANGQKVAFFPMICLYQGIGFKSILK